MIKLMRKDLTPDQMRRANITTSITVAMAYFFFIVIILVSKEQNMIEKIVFTSFFCGLVCNHNRVYQEVY